MSLDSTPTTRWILVAFAFLGAIVGGWRWARGVPEEPAASAASADALRAPAPARPARPPEPPPPPPGASPEELLEHRRHSVEGVGVSQVEMEQLLSLLMEGEAQVTPLGVACGPPPCLLAFSHDPNNTLVVGQVRSLAEAFGGADAIVELSWEDRSNTGYLWFSPRGAGETELEALRLNAEAHRAALAPR